MQPQPHSFPRFLTPLWLISPFFLWGTAMVAMKGIIPHTTPLFIAGFRLLPAGILVLIFAALMGKSQPQGWLAWLWIILFAIVDGLLFQGFLAEGLVRTGAGLGSAIIDSQPIAVALLSLWLLQEHIGFWGWLGLGLGVIGISLIGLNQDLLSHLLNSANMAIDISQPLFSGGEWLMLLAALSMAVGTVMIPFVTQYTDPVIATGWHMVLAGLPLWTISAIFEDGQWQNLVMSDWLALGYSTVFGSAIAYGLFFYFAASGNLTSLSSLTFFTPIFALIFGNLFLSEALSSIQWVGVCLTLISIYLINQRKVLSRPEWTNTLNAEETTEITVSQQPSASDTSVNSNLNIAVTQGKSQPETLL